MTDQCSDHFTYEMLFHCGETWQRLRCVNQPEQAASWLAYADLATQLLDPVAHQFGMPVLTFGFCGPLLRRQILSRPCPRIAPTLDQHAAHELNRQGLPVCSRGGAAVDLMIEGLNSYLLAEWISQHLPFDRLYLYAADRPLHLSYGPQHSRQMVLVQRQGSRVRPRKITIEQLSCLIDVQGDKPC